MEPLADSTDIHVFGKFDLLPGLDLVTSTISKPTFANQLSAVSSTDEEPSKSIKRISVFFRSIAQMLLEKP